MSGPGRSHEERLQRLLEEYGHVLRRAIARAASGLPDPEVDDVEQEARLRVWRALRREVELERPASYLYRVARTATLDALRRLRARREDSLQDRDPEGVGPAAVEAGATGLAAPPPSPETTASHRQQVARVRSAVQALPDNRRRAVGLYLQGFNAREIGDLLGWTEPKARNLLYRGLADVRRALSEDREPPRPRRTGAGGSDHETD